MHTSIGTKRLEFLSAKLAEYSVAQPGLQVLKNRLLAIGGEMIVPREDIDLDRILETGALFDYLKIIFVEGSKSECHLNAQVYADLRPNAKLATGWALTEDGLWRQHSWCWIPDRRVIIETTELRTKYFGVLLSE